jgi:glutathionylspermidine synthase
VRTLRFDFHYTTDGWRISEVNSDVPGGYAEASVFPKLVADCVPSAKPAGNPAAQWANAMTSTVAESGTVALLSAVGFLEDQQVIAFLAIHLQQRGIETVLLHHPEQLTWKSRKASAMSRGKHIGLGAIIRFYQGEWLARSADRNSWKRFFVGGETPITNPGSALLTESKRFPLTWDGLSTEMSTWRKLLPESRDPRDTGWQMGDDWVLKLSFSNTGDEVYVRELMNEQAWSSLCRRVRKNPSQWIAQRRFQPVAVASAVGPVFPCIGVYVIDGRAAGAYARASTYPVIDYAAMDVALLIRDGANV